MSASLREIVDRLGGDLVGDGDLVIESVATLERAGPQQISFLANPKYRSQLKATRAAAVVVPPEAVAECLCACIATRQPYLYYAKLAQWLHPRPRLSEGVHPSAVVEVQVPSSVAIGANVHIGAGAVIGEHAVIEANCAIGAGCEIGAGAWLFPNVTIYAGCRIGQRAIVHSGAIIGSDGFGFARETDGSWVKIPQIGRVLIGDDVEIGANTTIDRGALGDTVIEDGVKLDNLIQVAHNVRIGAGTAMAACVGVAGSAQIGRRCTVGGAAVILGHLAIADDVNISAGTLVGKSISRPGTYTGTVPFLEHGDWLKNFSRLRHLDALADKIRALEARLAEMEKKS